MSEEAGALQRVRFFGVHDLAAGWYVGRVAELAKGFDLANVQTSTAEVIELHNVQQYLENGFFPVDYTDEMRAFAQARVPQIRSAVARFFSSIDDANCASRVAGIEHEYHSDLLELLARNRAFERCGSATMLQALSNAGVQLGDLLACKKLVEAYDGEIRDLLRSSPRNAEHLVRKHWQKDIRGEIYLPASFTVIDARELLASYVDSPDAHPNYVGLIETAQVSPSTGIDAKLKLRAKRRNAEMAKQFFEETAGFMTGTEVAISEAQDEPVKYEMDDSEGMVARLTYSSRWLEQTCDNPSVLNTFQHLFEFADSQALLVLPSYPANLGVFERFMTTTGKTDYQVGAAFRAVDMLTLLQTRLYQHYLGEKGIELEEVISWFFETYLVEEFGALNFSFAVSSSGTSYLQRVRHLFVEMESAAAQFALFVEGGELDRDLLVMTSDGVRYKELPSLVAGKYLYPTDGDEISGILHTLFSDQSGLTYINESLKADNASRLLLDHDVAHDDLHDYQKQMVDHFIRLGVLVNTGTRVRIANAEQFVILRSLFSNEAVSYYHLGSAGRAEADAMIERGWVTRRSSLLTEAEGKYFNYILNNSEFSNGPALRNKYLHGSQPNADGEEAHFQTYITALRLTVALVIKVNDDFCLSAREKVRENTRE